MTDVVYQDQASLDPRSRVVRRRDLPSAALGATTRAVMNAKRDNYFAFRDVSAVIWDLLSEEIAVGEICTRLHAVFEVDQVRCTTETIEFLEELLREGLIQARDESGRAPCNS